MRSRAEKESAILWCLARSPGMTGPELCEITGLWRSWIYVHLHRLSWRGLVRRDESEPHRSFKYYICQPDQTRR